MYRLALLGYFCVIAPTLSAQTSNRSNSENELARKSTDDFTVATWNVEWFYDEFTGDNFSDLAKEQSAPDRKAWEWKRDTVAKAIAKLKCDVIGFQEIEGQRVLYYLTQSLRRLNAPTYRIGFIEGTDYFTEQDVGFLVRRGTDIARISRYEQTQAMFESKQFQNVSKHTEVVLEVPVGDTTEKVTIINVHFRAREEAVAIRTLQAKLIHHWVSERIAAGENIIVLGDTNSEVATFPAPAGSDIAALTGKETPNPNDDLIDLSEYLGTNARDTHLLPGKIYDRILVSPSLVTDTPGRPDLVFQKVEVRKDLNVRGRGLDTPSEHWDDYWATSETERDLSDHCPVVATFQVK